MYNDIENYIRFYVQLIINLIVDFCFSEYVEFLQSIHHLTFVGDVDGIHDVFHWADGVPVFYQALGKTGFIISVFKISKVLLEPGFERSKSTLEILNTEIINPVLPSA